MTLPVRRVRHHGKNIIVVFQSIKMKQRIRCESTIEGDLPYFLEYDPTVLAYYPQPFIITVADVKEKNQSYTPDFQVIRKDRKEIIECKPKAFIADEHTKNQIKLGTDWAYANNHNLVLVTDEDLRTDHVLANLKLLWRYSRLRVPTILLNTCITYLKAYPQGLSLERLARFLCDAPNKQVPSQFFTQIPFIYSMLFRHIILVNLDSPITLSSIVWLTPTNPNTSIISSLIRGTKY